MVLIKIHKKFENFVHRSFENCQYMCLCTKPYLPALFISLLFSIALIKRVRCDHMASYYTIIKFYYCPLKSIFLFLNDFDNRL